MEHSAVKCFVASVVLIFTPTLLTAGEPPEQRPWTRFPSPGSDTTTMESDNDRPPGNELILIVAGWGSDSDNLIYWPLYRGLKQAGYTRNQIFGISSPSIAALESATPKVYAKDIAQTISGLAKERSLRVDVIAHSLGGVAARWAVEKTSAGKHVDDLITIGTPHRGNYYSYLVYFTTGGKTMVPGSDFLEQLNPDEFTDSVAYLNLWSMTDLFFLDRSNAKIPEHVVERNRNVEQMTYSITPHLMLPYVTVDELIERLD